MTILPPSMPLSSAAAEHAGILAAAASAVAEVLPAVSTLVPGTPQPGTPGVAAGFAGAALASFEGLVPGAIAVLVGQDLVDALEASPLGSLDLAAATQPALDAAAVTLGGQVGAARTVPLDLIADDLGPTFTVVPLVGASGSAALLVSDDALDAAGAPAATPVATPAASTPTAAPVGAAPVTRGLEMLHGVVMDVTVELGRTRMTVRELLALTPGHVARARPGGRKPGGPAGQRTADRPWRGRRGRRGLRSARHRDRRRLQRELTVVELVVRLVFSLAVVLGLLMLLARFGAKRSGRHRRPGARACTGSRCPARSSIAVVTVGSRVLVLGATEQQVQLLTELDPEELEGLRRPRRHRASRTRRPSPGRARTGDPTRLDGLRRPGPLAGSVLSAQTWKQALAAATRKDRAPREASTAAAARGGPARDCSRPCSSPLAAPASAPARRPRRPGRRRPVPPGPDGPQGPTAPGRRHRRQHPARGSHRQAQHPGRHDPRR